VYPLTALCTYAVYIYVVCLMQTPIAFRLQCVSLRILVTYRSIYSC